MPHELFRQDLDAPTRSLRSVELDAGKPSHERLPTQDLYGIFRRGPAKHGINGPPEGKTPPWQICGGQEDDRTPPETAFVRPN